jgi:hypothetical protein
MFALDDELECNRIVDLIIDALVDKKEHKSNLRLKILVSVFNMVLSTEAKLNTLRG